MVSLLIAITLKSSKLQATSYSCDLEGSAGKAYSNCPTSNPAGCGGFFRSSFLCLRVGVVAIPYLRSHRLLLQESSRKAYLHLLSFPGPFLGSSREEDPTKKKYQLIFFSSCFALFEYNLQHGDIKGRR